ncbi:MAG: FtsX-like permease family protein [Planctomycetota bacterium]
MTPLAWKNLSHNWVRTSVGVAGVGFAAMLIFMQMGFKGAIESTATQVYDALEFDLMIRSPAYLHLTEPRTFSRRRLRQAESLPSVAAARPLLIALSEWQTPGKRGQDNSPDLAGAAWTLDQGPASTVTSGEAKPGLGRGILVLGVNPADPPFAVERNDLADASKKLTSSRFVLMDDKSKPEYGPQNDEEFGEDDLNVRTALGPNRVVIKGVFTLGSGMVCNGACMVNDAGFQAAYPLQPPGEVNLGLVTLVDANADDADRNAAKLALEQLYDEPDDVEILTRQQVVAHERDHWMQGTPFGVIFTLGVFVSILVGVAIVYQVLSTDIDNLLGEYATLKAMGYGNNYLSSVVLRQALLLALVSYVPSLLVALGLYQAIRNAAGIPMELTFPIAAQVLALTITMCLVSGAGALRKLFTADPASLF